MPLKQRSISLKQGIMSFKSSAIFLRKGSGFSCTRHCSPIMTLYSITSVMLVEQEPVLLEDSGFFVDSLYQVMDELHKNVKFFYKFSPNKP